MRLHVRAIPLLLDGLLRGIVLYALFLILGFVGLAGRMGLGSMAFVVLGVAVPAITAIVYAAPQLYGLRGPRRWSASWWGLFIIILGALSIFYFVSGALLYGRMYFWHDILWGVLAIGVMMAILEGLYIILTEAPLAFRIITVALCCVLGLGMLVFSV